MQPIICLPLRAAVALHQRESSQSIQNESRLAGRTQVNRPIKMVSATLVLGVSLGATGVAYAADDATLNRCWGQATKQFAPLGAHASSQDEPRQGVGNVSKGFGELGDGGQGKHAIAVAPDSIQSSLPAECQGTDMP
jgi:hypothetical protein